MTCIVGLVDGADAVIGGDHVSGAGYILRDNGAKVFRRPGVLFGSTGSYRVSQVIEIWWEPPGPAFEYSVNAIVREIIPVWRELFRAHGVMETRDGAEQVAQDNQAMLVARTGVFQVGQGWGVTEGHHPDPAANRCQAYDSLGSGLEVALGALCATRGMPAFERVEKALVAAATHVSTVRGPFTILKL